MKVPNNAFASSFVLKSENPQQKHINYCSKHTVKMQWVVHKCLTGSVDLERVEPPLKATPARDNRQRSCYWRFSTWRSRDVCMNQFAKNDQKNGGKATGSRTTTMCPHTLHILCSSFWPNMATLSCSSRHTHQNLHRVTFS